MFSDNSLRTGRVIGHGRPKIDCRKRGAAGVVGSVTSGLGGKVGIAIEKRFSDA